MDEQVFFNVPLLKLEPIFKRWIRDVINDVIVRKALEVIKIDTLIDSDIAEIPGFDTRIINVLYRNRVFLNLPKEDTIRLGHLTGIDIRNFRRCRDAGKKTIDKFIQLLKKYDIEFVM